jgi:phage FluMu protein Com
MKNLIYAGVIGVCVLLAVVVFVKTRGGGSGINDLSDSEMTWVKCLKCNQGYEMSLKQYITQVSEKSMANPSPMPVTLPLTCEKCSKDGIVKACKCEKCGEVFREGAVQNDFPDRCPKCKHSATEAKREANKAARQQG